MEMCGPVPWEALPGDIYELIFSKIESQHVGSLRLVNSSWRAIANRTITSLEIKRRHSVSDVDSLVNSLPKLASVQTYTRDEGIFLKMAAIKSLTELDVKLEAPLCIPPRSNVISYGVEHLSSLSTLKLFWSRGYGSATLNMISHLTNLTSLSLKRGLACRLGQYKYTQHLSCLVNLTNLDLHMLPLINLDFVSGLTNLEVLSLGSWALGVHSVDVRPLIPLTRLVRLDLMRTNTDGIEDVVGKFKNLTWLDIKDTRAHDGLTTILAGLTNLTHLDLSDNDVTTGGVESLTGLTSLKRLFLNANPVHHAISALMPLTGLEVLHLDNTPTDVFELAGLCNLVQLRDASVVHLTGAMSKHGLEELSSNHPGVKFRGLATRLLFLSGGQNIASQRRSEFCNANIEN